MTDFVLVPISIGELYDKISILEIKNERIKDAGKLANVKFELETLLNITRELPQNTNTEFLEIYKKLKNVNESIWDAENILRKYENDSSVDEQFISTARANFINNDRRAVIKRDINTLFGSKIFEEKSHE